MNKTYNKHGIFSFVGEFSISFAFSDIALFDMAQMSFVK